MERVGSRERWWEGIAVLVFIGVLLFFEGPRAYGEPVEDALAAGGSRLADTQNDDGGWPAVATADGGPSAANTFGIVGLGLLSAYDRTGDLDFREAALMAGDALVEQFKNAPRGDRNPATDGDRPFPQDIELLVALADLLETESQALFGAERAERRRQARKFSGAARSWFRNTTRDFQKGSDLVDRFLEGRDEQGLRSLAAWDIASAIRAALGVRSARFGEEMVAALLAEEDQWKDTDANNQFGGGPPDNPFSFDFTVLGSGSLLSAFRAFGKDEIGRGSNKIDLLAENASNREFLVGNQGEDGSWVLGHTQTTAYALGGLNGGIGGLESELDSLQDSFPVDLDDVENLEDRISDIRNKVQEIKDDAISNGRLISSKSTRRELSEIHRAFRSITRSLPGRATGLSRQTRNLGSQIDRKIRIIANPRRSAAQKALAETQLAALIDALEEALADDFEQAIEVPLADLLERLNDLQATLDDLNEAVANAAEFLVCSQLGNGGFLAPSPLAGEENPREEFEIDAEVLQGLGLVTQGIDACPAPLGKTRFLTPPVGMAAAPAMR